MKTFISIIAMLAALSVPASAKSLIEPQPTQIKPLFDFPLRHTHIARAPDGAFYMTGTLSANDRGEDFQNNAGVRLWKSTDLTQWTDLGLVWDLKKEATEWQQKKHLNREQPDGPLVRGVTAPEIHFLKGGVFIAYSMNGHGCGLLKSKTGKPEGPYVDLGQITPTEGDASLFEDYDGTVYFIWGPGYIAPLNADRTALAGPARSLFENMDICYVLKASGLYGTFGCEPVGIDNGVSLFKIAGIDAKGVGKKQYQLHFSSGNSRFGVHCQETMGCSSEHLYGPYSQPEVVVNNGGHANLFQDADGNVYCTYYGVGHHAAFHDRPAIAPVPFNGIQNIFCTHRMNFFTDRGPWAEMAFLVPENKINDLEVHHGPDGYYYFTGSNWEDDDAFKVFAWRSRDLKNWEKIGPLVTFDDLPYVKHFKQDDPEGYAQWKARPNYGIPWSTILQYFEGKYRLMFYPGSGGKAFSDFIRKNKYLKTVQYISDKGEGPYALAGYYRSSQPYLFKDDDGTIYDVGLPFNAVIDKDCLTELSRPKKKVFNMEGIVESTDPMKILKKIEGKYVRFLKNVQGGNTSDIYVADDIDGPWGRPVGHLGYGGNSAIFQHEETGTWYMVNYDGYNVLTPWVLPLHVEKKGDTLEIMYQYEKDYLDAREKAKGP